MPGAFGRRSSRSRDFQTSPPDIAELEPIAPRVELITTASDSEPFSAVPHLQLRGQVCVVPDARTLIEAIAREDFGRSAPVAEVRGTISPGVTTVFRLSENRRDGFGATAGEVCLWRPPAETGAGTTLPDTSSSDLQLTLVLEGYAPSRPETSEEENLDPIDRDESDDRSEPAARPPASPVFQRQQAILRPFPLAETQTLGIFLRLRTPFTSSPVRSFAVVMELSPADAWNEQDRLLYTPSSNNRRSRSPEPPCSCENATGVRRRGITAGRASSTRSRTSRARAIAVPSSSTSRTAPECDLPRTFPFRWPMRS